MQDVELPQETKAKVKAKVLSEAEAPTAPVRHFNMRRAVVIAAAVLLIAAVMTVPLSLMRPAGNIDVIDIYEDGDDIFPSYKTPENKGGETKHEAEEFSYDYLDEVSECAYKASTERDVEWGDAPLFPEDIDSSGDIIKAGTLTAGYTDDNVLYDSFSKLYGNTWSEAAKDRPFVGYNRIKVTTYAGARVALLDSDNKVIARGVANAGGVAYVYYDPRATVAKVVYKKGDYQFSEDYQGGDVNFLINEQEYKYSSLDLMLMIDTTGSMGDELRYINEELIDIVDRIKRETGCTDVRVSVNFYRDHGDEYTVSYYEFTDDIETAKKYISEQFANGGGDFPEAVDEALISVVNHSWREDAAKVCFFVLDAPAHSESERQGVNSNIKSAVTAASELGIRICPIASSGVDTDCEMTMRTAAAYTGGTYIFLTDDSGIGYSHKAPDDVQSGTFLLNELMIKTVKYHFDGSKIAQ